MNKTIRQRDSKGAVMAEFACVTVVQVMIFVFVLAFAVNAYFCVVYSFRANIVATESAKVYSQNKFWLHTPRPDFDPEQGRQRAIEAAKAASKALGMSENLEVEISDEPSNSSPQDSAAEVVKAKISYRGLPIPFGGKYLGGIFPAAIAVKGEGVALEPLVRPYSMLLLAARPEHAVGKGLAGSQGNFHIVALPAFGFGQGNAAAHPPGTPLPLGNFGNMNPVPDPVYWRALTLQEPNFIHAESVGPNRNTVSLPD